MSTINYLKGDATSPQSSNNKIIVHICNDIGGWGKGFVVSISRRWKEPENAYRNWYASKIDFALGETQFIQVENDIWVANMIGQHKINIAEDGTKPIRYDAVKQALQKVADFAIEINAGIHMPRIGCGLAGGHWEEIEPIIIDTLICNNIEVTVYDFN